MNQRYHKNWTIAVAAASLTVALAGCGSGDESGGGGDVDDAIAAGDFTYWSMWSEEEPQAIALTKIIEAYEEEKGVDIDVQWQGREVLNQVATNLLGGDVPDLVEQDNDQLGALLVEPGETVDLSDVYASTPPGEDAPISDVLNENIVQGLKSYSEGDGTHYLPWVVAGSDVVLFNANDPLVTAPPTTWEETLEICDEAVAAGRGCFGLDGDVGYYAQLYFQNLLTRNGGEEALNALITDTTGEEWQTPEVRTSLEQLKEAVDKGFFSEGYNASKWPQQQNAWAEGKSVFMLNGSYVLGETKDFQPADFEAGAIAFPATGTADNVSVGATSWGFSVLEQGQNPAGAKDFLVYLMTKQNMSDLAEGANTISIRPDASVPAESQPVKDVLENNPVLQMETPHPDWYPKVVDVTVVKLILGTMSVDEVIEKASELQAEVVGS